MIRTRLPLPLLALGFLSALATGCARPEALQPPRLLTPGEIAAVTAAAEATPPENAAAARAEALRARAAAMRAARGTNGDALRRRAIERSLTGG